MARRSIEIELRTVNHRFLDVRVRTPRESTDVAVDDARLAAEVVAFAERADIVEELVRLRLHAEHMATLLGDEGAVGRRLEFLLQEMQREANTAAAKSADAPVSHAL